MAESPYQGAVKPHHSGCGTCGLARLASARVAIAVMFSAVSHESPKRVLRVHHRGGEIFFDARESGNRRGPRFLDLLPIGGVYPEQ